MRIRPVEPNEHRTFHVVAAQAGLSSPFMRLYLEWRETTAYIAEVDGEIVGTGVAIPYEGGTGWLGGITVCPDRQKRGIGQALVEWGEECLREQGAESIILLASAAGRPLYEKMGYEAGISYRPFQGHGLAPQMVAGSAPVSAVGTTPGMSPELSGGPDGAALRPMVESDWPEVLDLDFGATGERRGWALRAMKPGFAVGEPGQLRGFYLPAPWGGGPAIATDAAAGRLLIDRVRRTHGNSSLIVRVPEANQEAIRYLEACGFQPRGETTYMVKGRWPQPYRPDLIWSLFSFGMG